MNPLARINIHRRLRRQIEAFRPKLYRLAWSWCHDAQLADDLVQDALLRGLQHLDQLRDPKQLEVWLSRILANLHKDHLRRRKETVTFDEEALSTQHGPAREVYRQDLIGRVRGAVSRLNDDQRKVLTLVDLMEFSYADAAYALDIPVGTVMSRLCRARGQLKSLLETTERQTVGPHLRRVK